MSEGSPPVSPSTDGRPEMGSGGGDDDDDPLVGPSGGTGVLPGGQPMTGYDSDGVDLTGGGMDPDHPLLARAQAALKAQIVAARENVEAQLREKHESLRVRGLFLGMPPPAPSPASRSRPPPPPLPPRAARRGGRPWRGRALAFPA